MGEQENRKEFIERIAAIIDYAKVQKFNKQSEEMKPKIGEMLDGYKEYIASLGGNFIETAETYIECIKIAKDNELIGDVKVKIRIKDFSSASTNTDTKMLDDVFGMEIVTATEFEKEVLMLFNYLIFDIQRDKKYNKVEENKKNNKVREGYVAYHCTGDFVLKEDDNLEETIKQIVEETKTLEFKKSKKPDKKKVINKATTAHYKKQQEMQNSGKKQEVAKLVNVFPNLITYISTTKNLKEITRVLREMMEYVAISDLQQKQIPIMEYHFLTADVAEDAIRGVASHAKYKYVNEKLIREYYEKRKTNKRRKCTNKICFK